MKQLLIKLTLLLTLFSAANADETGSASIFTFFNGVALEKNEVVLDGKYSYFTDEDGSVELILETGEHQIEIFAKDENGQNLGYVKRTIEVKESRDTQVIATFKENSFTPQVEIDTPLGASGAIVVDATNTGIFHGIVLTSDKNLPIANARVFVKGTSIDAKTDERGNFYVEVPADTNLSLSVVHSEYSAQTINNVVVKKDETINQEVKLTPASMELEEFIVLAPKVEGSIASLMAEAKNSQSITNIIGAEQMKKQGDSNAASALKRVAGVTIIGGKSVYVRGLGDRYSATELNGLSLPSPDPFSRTVPLDMFPSGVIGSLEVQKSASADISSTFGGGYVNIRTKDEFPEDYAKLKVGITGHDSTGKDAITSKGGSTDFLGIDDGYRSLDNTVLSIPIPAYLLANGGTMSITVDRAFMSSLMPELGEERPTLTQSKAGIQSVLSQRSYNHQNSTVPLGSDFGVDFGKKIELANEHQLYVIGEYEYKSDSKNVEYKNSEYILSSQGVQSDTLFNESTTARNLTNIQHGGMAKIGYKYRSLDLKLTKLYVLNTLDQTRIADGTFGEGNLQQKQTYLDWQERELDVNQFSGGFDYEVYLPNRFDFGIESATANEYVPGDVAYEYRKLRVDGAEYQFLSNQSSFSLTSRNSDDELKTHYVKNKTFVPLMSDEDYIQFGLVNESKTRETRIASLRMQSRLTDPVIASGPIDGIINYKDADAGLRFDITSQPKESFNASFDKNALFVKTYLKPTDKFDITVGLRQVNVEQFLEQFDGASSRTITTKDSELIFDKTLPSFALKYTFDKSNQIKLAYSETFITPDFREFSSSEYIHPVFIAKVAGNPDLIETDIKSYDLEYGYYFDNTDNITAAVFYKSLDNPIEDVRTFTTSTLDRFSFENSQAAELTGIELSWYKNLAFLSDYAKDFTFFGNYTYINSEVSMTDEQKAKFVSSERGLQGLSPEVLNLSVMYQNKERSLNVAYNKMSERLMRVALKNGDVILGLDDYEEPPHLLDFTWIEKFDWKSMDTQLNLTFKIKNLLDSTTIWTQEEKTTLEYNEGTSYSLSISAEI